ncbi:hypothetical protein Pmani_006803 [Petrolisthes manimaculis]|uniref:Uncharacterized protein n=1 Tax=Petrolisthes manimaculis TaxID=1843537 RepID=A0AAE1Q9M8_9EUCA|nr:hypothetical protein Pmani_006803 [Petrolisthes manimaculis]
MGTLFGIPWALGWLPESPRWLITQARFQEALKVLKWAAKVNRNTLPSDDVILDAMTYIEKQAYCQEGHRVLAQCFSNTAECHWRFT